MSESKYYGGRTLRIAVGLTTLILMMSGGAGGTKIINETGRDCNSFGTWFDGTCTMTIDLNETIQIIGNGTTLDGNGHTINGIGIYNGIGVYVLGRSGVTIKNMNIKNCDKGLLIQNSNNINLIGNNVNGIYDDIYLYGSSNNMLIGNNAQNDIRLYTSNNNMLIGNNAQKGISLDTSNNNTLSGNYASNGSGISLFSSSSNTLTDNNANSNYNYGISLNLGSSNVLSDNNASSNKNYGIYLNGGSGNTLIGNNANSNNGNGIYLSFSSNNMLSDNNALNNSGNGITLYGSSNNTLNNNNANLNNTYGISLTGDSGNTLTGNNANSNKNYGISMSGSSNDILSNNNANLNNDYGISLSGSNNMLSSNTASNNGYGFYLSYSRNNTIINNIMMGNKYNFGLSNNYASDLDNYIDTSNLVDGKPVFFIKGASDRIYDSSTNAGMFYCINCINVTIKDMDLNKSMYGIYFLNTSLSRIQNVNASNNVQGIILSYSSNNMLSGNTASNNDIGFSLGFSDNNILSGNNVSNNTDTGILVGSSCNYTVFGNNISRNGKGIYLSVSSLSNKHSSVVYNNYFNNPNNFQLGFIPETYWNIPKTPGTNIIGGPYLGGNFWAYPNGTGFSQTCIDIDKDGICDSKYNPYMGKLTYTPLDYLPLSMNFTLDAPPASITNLTNITYAYTYINWTWTDPADEDFEHVEIYLNGTSRGNVAKGIQFFNVTSLALDTQYKITTRTVDVKGNVNETWVNSTARTSPYPIPVLLVHGWGGSSIDTWNKDMFTDRDLEVATFDYNSTQDIKLSAGELKDKIKTMTDDCKNKGYECSKIDIVAHSEGGLVAREYINSYLYRFDVRKLIMIGTPNHGLDIKRYGDIAGILAGGFLNPIYYPLIVMATDKYVGPAGFQMEPHSPFLQSLNGNDDCADIKLILDNNKYSVQYYTLTAHAAVRTISHKHFKILGQDFKILWFTPDGDFVVADNSLKLTQVQFERKENAGSHVGEGTNQVIIDQAISYLLEDTQNVNQLQQRQFAASNMEESPPYLSTQWLTPIKGKIYSEEMKTHTVFIDNTTKNANFNLFWEYGDLNLVLYSPDGMKINSSNALNYPGINHSKESIFEFYDIQNPQYGNWTMEITPINVSSMGENYSVITFIETDLFIGVGTNKDIYIPNEPITIIAYLQDSGSALPGMNVTAKISRPDGTNITVQLYNDGLHNDNQTDDGIYANVYTDTNVSGVYEITVLANGMKENNPFERIAFKTIWLEQYPDLTLLSSDINFSNEFPLIGEKIIINATINNIGDAKAEDASILFYDGDPANDELIGESIINISAGQSTKASISWNTTAGKHEINVLINPFNEFLDKNYSNDKAFWIIIVRNDLNPSTSLTNLSTKNIGTTWINFTWTNPTDPDFSHVILYMNGSLISNATAPRNYYNFTGLNPDTQYELGTHVVDSFGNVNGTWANASARTLPSGTQSPVADCGADEFNCENVASPIFFNASASYDPDGGIVSYYWDFGDGANSTSVAPVHNYSTYRWNGTAYQPFTVNLTVTDNSGMTNRTSMEVVVRIPGDANGDGKVNILDASIVGLKWGTDDPCADLNNDGKVNILDASVIGLGWGKTPLIR